MADNFKIQYSHQAQLLIKNMPDFDKADFEAWYLLNLPVGSGNIQMYLEYKDKESREVMKNGIIKQ